MTIVETRPITGGVDTHLDVHVAAALDPNGGTLGVESFPTTMTGFAELHTWLSSFGTLERVGVEGTGAYGAADSRGGSRLTATYRALGMRRTTWPPTLRPREPAPALSVLAHICRRRTERCLRRPRGAGSIEALKFCRRTASGEVSRCCGRMVDRARSACRLIARQARGRPASRRMGGR